MSRTTTAVQPFAAAVDFCSPAFKDNPFPGLASLISAGPVVRTQFPLFGQVWIATTYDAVKEVLSRHQQFLINPAAAGNRWMSSVVRWLPRNLQPLATNMLLRDEPDHRRLRSLVERAFQARRVEALRPRLEILADEAIETLAAKAVATGGKVDLLEHFARPFPLAVICELLGLPPQDRPAFTRWASRFSRSASPLGIALGLHGLTKLMRYLRGEIRRQRARPRDGLLAALIQAEEVGDVLSDDELLAMAFLLLAAGHETTLHQIACSVLTLIDCPEQRRELTGDWSLLEPAVDELLRHVSFAQVAKPRYAGQDTIFFGKAIRRGEVIFACLASANADPAHFDQPERLNFTRRGQRHLAFGTGIHYCLGATLACLETRIALQRLFTRFPDIRLAVPRNQIRYSRRPGTRALLKLPVIW